MANLTLEMRPEILDEVIGLKPQLEVIRKVLADGNKPKPFLLAGQFGKGKTTLARIIAKEVQGFEFANTRPQIQEINAANLRGIDAVRKLVESAGNYPLVGKYGVIILDEAQQLTKDAQQVLLNEFEVKDSPTVWILTTTNPEKINEGVRDRCVPLPTLKGMDDKERTELISRAVAFTSYAGPVDEFLAQLKKAKIDSPRKALKAFEGLVSGLSVQDAVSAITWEALPEYFEICMGVVFGQFDKDYSLPWMRDSAGQAKQFKSVAEQLKSLDEKLKGKAKDDAPVADDAENEAVDEGDVQGKPDVATALRAITIGILKGQIARETKKFNAAKAQRAADSLFILAHCMGPQPFGAEWGFVLGGLYRVNQKMQGK